MSPTPPLTTAARVRPRAALRSRPDGRPLPARPPYLYDPRPDLAADTHAWQALLELAFLLDGEAPDGLFGALHGVRCCGARLIPADGTRQSGAGYRMAPGDDYLGGARAWATDRQRWLVPAADVLTPVLRGLRAGADGCAAGAETATDGPTDQENEARDRSAGGRA
jgi:hypothetical protein